MTGYSRHHRRTGRSLRATCLAAMAVIVAAGVSSEPAQAFLARPIAFLGVGGVVKAPTGWIQFCAGNPADCRADPAVQAARVLTPELLEQLFAVNREVDARVRWTSDRTLYGKDEHWTYALDRGDCEDIVLEKRRLLAKAGWSLHDLLITVVSDPNPAAGADGSHAVLIVRTDRGDLVLDNQTPEILFWYETSYRFIKRQSTEDPNVWVALEETRPPTLAPAAPLPLPPPLALASR